MIDTETRKMLDFQRVLYPLGFDHKGEFYPIEFPVGEYTFIEIDKCAIAISGTYIAVLNFDIMEYWEQNADDDLIELLTEKTIEAVEKFGEK